MGGARVTPEALETVARYLLVTLGALVGLPLLAFLCKWVFSGLVQKLEGVAKAVESMAEKLQQLMSDQRAHNVVLEGVVKAQGKLEAQVELLSRENSDLRSDNAVMRQELVTLGGRITQAEALMQQWNTQRRREA